MVTRWIFLIVVLLLAVQRLFELRLSRRNEAVIAANGGVEYGAGHFPVMKLLHTAWFLAMILEVFLLDRPFFPALAAAAMLVAVAGQSLRYAAIRTLGWRWTVRVMVIPSMSPIQAGIYRTIRHPNYVGVVLEILAVPLLHTAFLTAVIFSIANVLLLWVRIRTEENALRENNEYDQAFAGKPRFFPNRYGIRSSDRKA